MSQVGGQNLPIADAAEHILITLCLATAETLRLPILDSFHSLNIGAEGPEDSSVQGLADDLT